VSFADQPLPEVTLNGGGDVFALQESGSVESISKLVEGQEEGKMPLKGETPPTGRRAKLIRRMTAASKGLKIEGKEWVNRIRRKGSGSEASSESDNEEKDKEKPRRFRMTRKKKQSKEDEGDAGKEPTGPLDLQGIVMEANK
jgi:hypothetical protein